jgi:hypothetical protein
MHRKSIIVRLCGGTIEEVLASDPALQGVEVVFTESDWDSRGSSSVEWALGASGDFVYSTQVIEECDRDKVALALKASDARSKDDQSAGEPDEDDDQVIRVKLEEGETEKILGKDYDYWEDEHEDFPASDWEEEVRDGSTRLGYWPWLEAKLRAVSDDTED